MPSPLTAEKLSEYAKQVEQADPIDWGMLSVNEDEAFLAMSTQVIDMANSFDPDARTIMLLASITKLLVENFVLQMQLYGHETSALENVTRRTEYDD